jgi:hypothetical protein
LRIFTDPGLGVDLHGADVRAVGKEKLTGSNGRVGVDRRASTPSGKLCAAKVASAISWIDRLVPGCRGRRTSRAELQVVLAGLEQVCGDLAGLGDHLLRGVDHRGPADDQRPGAVGVQAARGDRGVAVQHLDVLERHAELVGDELAPRRLVALAVRVEPVTTSTLPVGSIRIAACSQPPRRRTASRAPGTAPARTSR